MPTRRAFLKAGGLSLVSLSCGSLGGPAFLHRTALAAPPPGPFERRKVLVAIFQRGAMDALAAVPPIDDSRLRRARPRLFLGAGRQAGEEGLVDLGNGFGLHPAFAPLVPLYEGGRLAVVHAVGSPDPTRSHFDAQDFMETATPGRKGTASGWLNRVAGELGHEASPLRAVSLTSALPRSLYGPAAAVAVARLEDLRLEAPGGPRVSLAAGRGFEALYQTTSQELLREAGGETFEAVELLARLAGERAETRAGARYPSTPLGRSLRQIAVLIKGRVGLEVAFAESSGWDTHVQQGTVRGSFAVRAGDLARSIEAFWQDLGEDRDDVLVMTMTEFGRTVRENGSGGTDHGHGSCMLLLGAGIDGGRVHGRLPSLDPDNLYEGRDLPVTTDFRAVFSAVAHSHLGVADDETIFPGFAGEPLPVMRT